MKRPLTTRDRSWPSKLEFQSKSAAYESIYFSPISLGPQLEEVLDNPPMSEGLAVVPIDVLIYLKLVARRRRDLVDVVELVRAGADVGRVRDYLGQHASDLVPSFEELVNEALGE